MKQHPQVRQLSPKLVPAPVLYDRWLCLAVFGIIALGMLMVASASMVISEKFYGTSFYFLSRQLIYLGGGLILGIAVLRISIETWLALSKPLLIVGMILLVLVLIPGIGHRVNGSARWVGLSFLKLQVSEVAKFCVIVYLSGYIVKNQELLKTDPKAFIRPMILLGFVGLLLILEPDFGATVVITMTSLALLFLSGVRLWHFLILFLLICLALGLLAVTSPYRLERLTTFLNPWATQFGSGYQLTQSLIAFGRGSWFGVGLGGSVQKLFYLPEAHTDFLFAVLAEELGLIGELAVIGLYSLFVVRALVIARKAKKVKKDFASNLAIGIGLWIGLQAAINIGVNAGILPTKGLTLPLMSYGGSSLIIMCVAVAILFRIDYETRFAEYGIKTSR